MYVWEIVIVTLGQTGTGVVQFLNRKQILLFRQIKQIYYVKG
jgi:hypothetical protein